MHGLIIPQDIVILSVQTTRLIRVSDNSLTATCMQYLQLFRMAVQFLSFASTATAVASRPRDNPTSKEIISYTLQTEVRQNCKLSTYSGN